jgi:uncharacterized protein
LSESNSTAKQPAESLCLSCGLCCNGVIFAEVRLQPGDLPQRLRQLGLSLRPATSPRGTGKAEPAVGAAFRFQQPCTAFVKGRCDIYPDRPHHCRAFECLLFKDVQAGTRTRAQAEEIVRRARERADEVRALLRALGERNEHLPMAARFRRLNRRVTAKPLELESAEIFGRLTLAVHDLNLLLRESFYS